MPNMKNILVPLAGFAPYASAPKAALLFGWPSDAVIEAVHVQTDPLKIVMGAAVRQFGSSHGNRQLVLELQKRAVVHSAEAKETFERFHEQLLAAHAFGSALS